MINYVASMNLGIYLIHEHPMMYEHVFSIDWITSCATLSDILVTMALVLLIEYVVCFAIETVGKEVIDRALSKVITKELDETVITEKKNLNRKKKSARRPGYAFQNQRIRMVLRSGS